jgi:O-antigen ligase
MMGVWDLMHWVVLVLILASVMRTSRSGFWLINWNLFLVFLLCLISFSETYGVLKGTLPRILPDDIFPELIYRGCGSRICATLGNPSFFAAILVVNIPLAAGLFAQSYYRTKPKLPESRQRDWPLLAARVFWAICTLTFLWVLYQNGTRGAFIGLAASAIFLGALALFRVNKAARKPILAVAAVIFAGLTILYVWDIALNIPAPEGLATSTAGERITVNIVEDSSVQGRLVAARAGLKGFLQKPILGWGPDNFTAAFDRNVRPEDFKYGDNLVDNAHNKIINDLATVGLLGTLSYLVIWACLLWFVVRRRRKPEHEILVYAVLCSLAAYFVQNLLLFDTPAMILQWALLVGFVAAQERGFADEIAPSNAAAARSPAALKVPSPSAAPEKKHADSLDSLVRGPALALIAVVIIGLVGFSIYFIQYRTYSASHNFELLLEHSGNYRLALDDLQRTNAESRPIVQRELARLFDEQLEAFRKTIDQAPTLGNEPRRTFFASITNQASTYTPDQQRRALEAFAEEWARGIDIEPNNFQYLRTVLFLFQTFNSTEATAQSIEILLKRLEKVGPQRYEVVLHRSIFALSQGQLLQGVGIIEAYLAKVPSLNKTFVPIEGTLCRALQATAPDSYGKTIPCYKFLPTAQLLDRLKLVEVTRTGDYAMLFNHAYYTEDFIRAIAIADSLTARGGTLSPDMAVLADRARKAARPLSSQ